MFLKNGNTCLKTQKYLNRSLKYVQLTTSKRDYNTIIDRVTQDPITNLNILGCISSYQMTMLTFDISAGTTFILMGSLLKLSHPLIQLIMKRMIGEDVGQNIQKKFLYDLDLDAEYYGWSKSKHHYAKSFYKPSYAFSCILHSYLVIVFFKSINRICKYNHYYPEVLSSSLFGFGSFNLATIDSTLLLPSIVGILNYLVLRNPDHPFLVNFRHRYSSLPKSTDGSIYERINRSQNIWTPSPLVIAPIIGCIGVALPKAYLLAWIGYISTHLFVRFICRKRHI